MSPTTPTATWQTWCSAWFWSAMPRKGRKWSMYLAKSASTAAPTTREGHRVGRVGGGHVCGVGKDEQGVWGAVGRVVWGGGG